MPTAETALPGRASAIPTAASHFITGQPLKGPFPEGAQTAMFGMGCFWGVERKFWQVPGVVSTAVGYAAGLTPNPTYEEVCSGRTGHNEVVLVHYDPAKVTYAQLLKVFWESARPDPGHAPGQRYRHADTRSGIYVYSDEQRAAAGGFGRRLCPRARRRRLWRD